MKFHDLKTDEKLLLFVGAGLTILSLLALLFFHRLVGGFPRDLECSAFLESVFFALRSFLGRLDALVHGTIANRRRVSVRRNNVLLLFSLILAVLISAAVGFAGYQKYGQGILASRPPFFLVSFAF
jgi:hypothetical protein